jgi:hypothetical protein
MGAGGAAGAGGATILDCTGDFGAPELVLSDTAAKGSPAITGDELELAYARDDGSGTQSQQLALSSRGSKQEVFPVGRTLDELEAKCTAPGWRSIDLTADGLRVYFSCGTGQTGTAPFLFADRPDRKSPFVVRGEVATLECCPSVDPSELHAYASTDLQGQARPAVASRQSLDAPFGPAEAVLGLENGTLRSPDLAPDQKTLYGSVLATMGTMTQHIALHRRKTPDQPFGPEEAVLAPSPFLQTGAPDVTADCRALYIGAATQGATGFEVRLYVMRR